MLVEERVGLGADRDDPVNKRGAQWAASSWLDRTKAMIASRAYGSSIAPLLTASVRMKIRVMQNGVTAGSFSQCDIDGTQGLTETFHGILQRKTALRRDAGAVGGLFGV